MVNLPEQENEVIQRNLAPNLTETQQFLDLLAPGERFTFQTFDDCKVRKSRDLVRVFHGSLHENAAALIELNQRGAGVFFTVNRTDLAGRKAENITAVRSLFIDLDGAPLEPVLGAGEPPHIVIQSSPGRWHVYWSIKDCPLELFSAVQKALIAKFGADKSVHDLPRVMRLPGFWHRKADPFMVKVITVAGGWMA